MGRPAIPNPLKKAKQRYTFNKYRQRSKGWEITFEEWYKFFLDAGLDKNKKIIPRMLKETLCLIRYDETKPYSKANCYIATQGITNTGLPCRSLGRSRPSAWIVKDPEQHRKYMPFLRARAQANYRGEKWSLTFDQFAALWGDLWDLRGRASTDYCMTREDPEGPWDTKNARVITRSESLGLSRRREAEGKTVVRRRGPKKTK